MNYIKKYLALILIVYYISFKIKAEGIKLLNKDFYNISKTTINKLKNKLPKGFVYLHTIDPTIKIDIRYNSNNNFLGRPAKGYKTSVCICTLQAAHALSKIQKKLKKINKNYSLKIYDAYRPQKAVNDFWNWAKDPKDTKMQKIYYPDFKDKKKLFKGYIALKSGHSRGSTFDLTIIDTSKAYFINNQTLRDDSINMGSLFDYLGVKSNFRNNQIKDIEAIKNRNLLRKLMSENGFKPYDKEWWHFTLIDEPFPDTYFNFDIE